MVVFEQMGEGDLQRGSNVVEMLFPGVGLLRALFSWLAWKRMSSRHNFFSTTLCSTSIRVCSLYLILPTLYVAR